MLHEAAHSGHFNYAILIPFSFDTYLLLSLFSLARTRDASSGDNMISVFKKIFREDGPRGLYRGLAPNFMKVVPAVSISYVVYEHLRMSLGVI